jgi:hypothetical protein
LAYGESSSHLDFLSRVGWRARGSITYFLPTLTPQSGTDPFYREYTSCLPLWGPALPVPRCPPFVGGSSPPSGGACYEAPRPLARYSSTCCPPGLSFLGVISSTGFLAIGEGLGTLPVPLVGTGSFLPYEHREYVLHQSLIDEFSFLVFHSVHFLFPLLYPRRGCSWWNCCALPRPLSPPPRGGAPVSHTIEDCVSLFHTCGLVFALPSVGCGLFAMSLVSSRRKTSRCSGWAHLDLQVVS